MARACPEARDRVRPRGTPTAGPHQRLRRHRGRLGPAFLGALGETFTVVCPENRGMGDAPLGDPAVLTIEAMAADVEALLDERGIERRPWRAGRWAASWPSGWRRGRRAGSRALILHGHRPRRDGRGPRGPGGVGAADRPRRHAARAGQPVIALLFPPEFATVIDREFGDVVASARAALSTEALSAQEAAMAAMARRLPAAGGSRGAARADRPWRRRRGRYLRRTPTRWPPTGPPRRVERLAGGGHAFMAQEPDRVAGLIADFAST